MLLFDSVALGNPVTVNVRIHVRINNEDLYFTRTAQQYIAASGNPLVTSKHSLPNNPRYLVHAVPGSLTYPSWVPYNGQNHATVPAVDRYREHHLYGSYTKVSGANPSMNCHGYSTGTNVWLDDFRKLVNDDWHKRDMVADLVPGAAYGTNAHSIKINGIAWEYENNSNVRYTVFIAEKWRDSGIYSTFFSKRVKQNPEVELNLKNLTETVVFEEFYVPN